MSRLPLKTLPFVLAGCLLIAACSDDEGPPDDAQNASTADAGATDEDATTDVSANADDDAGEDQDATTPGDDAGGESELDTGSDADEPSCVPGESAWEQNAQPIVEQYCGDCHGETPQFGAPYPLVDYHELMVGPEGQRPVDAIVEQLLSGDMPPAATPQLPHAELDTLVGWASCGEEHPDYTQELEASAPVWEAPEDPPAGLEYFDVTADGFDVAPDLIDEYRCFSMEVPIESPQLMRRIEPIIDDGRVLHHFVMAVDRSQSVDIGDFECPMFPPGDDHVYAWGPGQTALEFDDGGIALDPGDRLVLQIHYNNGAGLEDVQDSSGLRIYHEEPEGSTEYAMAEQTILSIHIPANSIADATTSCTVQQEVELVGTWPHMHEIGSEFEQTVTRADGTVEPIVTLTGWHFEAQLLYHTPMTLHEGDELNLTCLWDNPHDHNVNFGTGTDDEMCFSFMYVTPPHSNFCH